MPATVRRAGPMSIKVIHFQNIGGYPWRKKYPNPGDVIFIMMKESNICVVVEHRFVVIAKDPKHMRDINQN